MLELSRARDLGRPLFPVWRAPCDLPYHAASLLLGSSFADFSTDAAFEEGYARFAAGLRAALEGPGQTEGGEAAARALLARPEARCDPSGPAPFLLVSALPEDAGAAGALLSALAFRRIPCWLDLPLQSPGGPLEASSEEAGAALASPRCAALVPLVRSLDRLLESVAVPSGAGAGAGAAVGRPSASASEPAGAGPAAPIATGHSLPRAGPGEGGAGGARAATAACDGELELAALEARIAQLEREVAAAEAAAAAAAEAGPGTRGSASDAPPIASPRPPPPPSVRARGRPPHPATSTTRACSVM
eukprot:tig00000190_g13842.t1